MSIRTTKTTVTFAHPFVVGDLDEIIPPGVYEVETDEELLEGVSFQAYRRVQTLIFLPAPAGLQGVGRALQIDPGALAAALERDRALTARREAVEDGRTDPPTKTG